MGNSMSREPHIEAVGFAGLQVQELQNILMSAKEVQQEVLGLIISAVGENPVVESAVNAFSYMAAVGDHLDEVIGQCETIKAELNRYGGGF
jgi:hypothetical protein